MGRAGKALRKVLQTHGISQNRLAVMMEVDRSNISRWVSETRDPTAEAVAEIKDALEKLDPAAAEEFVMFYLYKTDSTDAVDGAAVNGLVGAGMQSVQAEAVNDPQQPEPLRTSDQELNSGRIYISQAEFSSPSESIAEPVYSADPADPIQPPEQAYSSEPDYSLEQSSNVEEMVQSESMQQPESEPDPEPELELGQELEQDRSSGQGYPTFEQSYPGQTDLEQDYLEQTTPEQVNPEQASPEQVNPEQVNPEQATLEPTDIEQSGSEQRDSDQINSGQANLDKITPEYPYPPESTTHRSEHASI